jgi:5-methylcytosine-specific restriction endonuclease McrA
MNKHGRYYWNNQDAFDGESRKYRDGITKKMRKAVLRRMNRLCVYELRALYGKDWRK